MCDKRERANADLLHNFVKSTKSLWSSVFLFFFPKLFNVQLDPDPVLMVIGLWEQSQKQRHTGLSPVLWSNVCKETHSAAVEGE